MFTQVLHCHNHFTRNTLYKLVGVLYLRYYISVFNRLCSAFHLSILVSFDEILALMRTLQKVLPSFLPTSNPSHYFTTIDHSWDKKGVSWRVVKRSGRRNFSVRNCRPTSASASDLRPRPPFVPKFWTRKKTMTPFQREVVSSFFYDRLTLNQVYAYFSQVVDFLITSSKFPSVWQCYWSARFNEVCK